MQWCACNAVGNPRSSGAVVSVCVPCCRSVRRMYIFFAVACLLNLARRAVHVSVCSIETLTTHTHRSQQTTDDAASHQVDCIRGAKQIRTKRNQLCSICPKSAPRSALFPHEASRCVRHVPVHCADQRSLSLFRFVFSQPRWRDRLTVTWTVWRILFSRSMKWSYTRLR